MKDVSFESVLKLSFNNSLLDIVMFFYMLFFFANLVYKVSFYSDLNLCSQRLKPVSECQNFSPFLPKSSISNLQLNSQSECRIQQGWRRMWMALERVRLPSFGSTCKGPLTTPSVLRCSLHVAAAPARKVAGVNPDWQGHYGIPPHTSNEHGNSQTGLRACTHSHAHADLRRPSGCFC